MKAARSHFAVFSLAAAFAVLVTAGCGGGGAQGGATVPSTSNPGTGNSTGPTVSTTIRITIPSALTTALRRRPQYVSPATEGLLLRAYADDNGAQGKLLAEVAVALTPGSSNCTGSGTSLSCTATIAVPAGNTIFVFTTYSVAPSGGSFGSATPIGAAVVTQDIIANQANNVSVDLGGVVVSVQASFNTPQVHFIPPAAPALTLTYYDANNNAIISGPYVDQNGNPITYTLSATEDANSSITVPSGAQTPGTPATVNYSGLAAAPFTSTITATLSNGPTTTTTLTIEAIQLSFYPITDGEPFSITNGPDGALWYGTTAGFNRITVPNSAGQVTQTGPFGTASIYGGITTGPDGALWAIGGASNSAEISSVDRLPVGGASTPYTIAGTNEYCNIVTTGSLCTGNQIITGPDDALWFSETFPHAFGRISTGGAVSTYPVTIGNSAVAAYALGIAKAPTGSSQLMYVNYCNDPFTPITCTIASLSTSGVITPLYTLTDASGEYVYNLTVGYDGNIWFTSGPIQQQTMYAITPSGAVAHKVTLPVEPVGLVNAITTNPDTAVWFTSYADGDYENCADTDDLPSQDGEALVRVMTNGSLYDIILSVDGYIKCFGWGQSMVSGPDGALWFIYDGAAPLEPPNPQIGPFEVGRAI
jgi:virginiamycin B lyase